jgi:hypothetical protein
MEHAMESSGMPINVQSENLKSPLKHTGDNIKIDLYTLPIPTKSQVSVMLSPQCLLSFEILNEILVLLCSIILGRAEVKEIDCEDVDWILLAGPCGHGN